MLSARYLAGCSNEIVELYAKLESRILNEMAKRLAALPPIVDDKTLYMASVYKELGGLESTILDIIKKSSVKNKKELLELFDYALKQSVSNDVKLAGPGINLSDEQRQVLEITLKKQKSAGIVNGSKKVIEDVASGKAIKMFSGLERLTMTIAATGQADFIEAANGIYMDVASGAFDYQTALFNHCDTLAKKGVTTVEYTDSGKYIYRSIESAVRSNVMTGINQAAAAQTLDTCENLETDLVEVSAHLGARPEHAAFQGKVYCLNGERDYIDGNGETQHAFNFSEVCHPGEPTGICGINCRHSYYPYFEGTPLRYSDGQLSEMEDPKVTFTKGDGSVVTMSQYEAEQIQRNYERQVRQWKRSAEVAKTIGNEDDERKARNKIYILNQKLRNFTDETGLRRDKSREYIGTKNGKQPQGLKPAGLD